MPSNHPPPENTFLLPPPKVLREPPPMTDEMRARLVAHMDEMLAHIHEPLPEGEPDWDVDELFPPAGRAMKLVLTTPRGSSAT